jgi:hypothetical protein
VVHNLFKRFAVGNIGLVSGFANNKFPLTKPAAAIRDALQEAPVRYGNRRDLAAP